MTLLDAVRLGGYQIHYSLKPHITKSNLKLMVESAIAVDISKTYSWIESEWYGICSAGEAHKHFQDIRPSFPVTWWEWDVFTPEGNHRNRAILACESHDMIVMYLFDRQYGSYGTVLLTHMFGVPIKWDLNDDGISVRYEIHIPDISLDSVEYQECCGRSEVWTEEEQLRFIQHNLLPVLVAQNFMHCRLVTLDANPPKPTKVDRKFLRNHGIKPALFSVINIGRMKKMIHRLGGIKHLGIEKVLHLVRAHKVTYTSERPLFNRVVGTFFRKAHKRGNKELGEKQTAYQVLPPTTPGNGFRR